MSHSNLQISSNANPPVVSILMGKKPKVDFGKNIRVAASQALEWVKLSNHWTKVAAKVTLAIPTAILLTAVTISLVCLGFLFYVAAFPMAMTAMGWNKKNINDYWPGATNDLKAFAISVMTYLIKAEQFDPKPLPVGQKASRTPILAENGFLHHSGAWHFFRSELKKAGAGPFYTIDVGSPFESIEQKAKRIKTKIEQIAKDTGRNDIVFFCHSMGGLSGSYCATKLLASSSIQCKGVITLGSPFKGTKMARMAPGVAAKQMRHQSVFTKDLNGAIQNATQTKFFQLRSKTDLVVRPKSARSDDASHIISHEYDSLGHLAYLYSTEVADDAIKCYNSVAT